MPAACNVGLPVLCITGTLIFDRTIYEAYTVYTVRIRSIVFDTVFDSGWPGEGAVLNMLILVYIYIPVYH